MANSYLVWAHVCPDVSSRSGLDAVYLSIEKKMFPARMLKEVTACREVGESRLHKRLEAPPPVLFFSGGFSFLWRQTLETAMFPSLRCVAASQIRPRE